MNSTNIPDSEVLFKHFVIQKFNEFSQQIQMVDRENRRLQEIVQQRNQPIILRIIHHTAPPPPPPPYHQLSPPAAQIQQEEPLNLSITRLPKQ